MNDSVFLDTNILVYSYSISETDKQIIARNLIKDHNSFISTQVLQELSNIVTRKFKFSYMQAAEAVNESCSNNNIYSNSADTVLNACRIAQRYQFSFYDSLIIAAALECNCAVLYSEDLSNGQLIDGKLKISNPFI